MSRVVETPVRRRSRFDSREDWLRWLDSTMPREPTTARERERVELRTNRVTARTPTYHLSYVAKRAITGEMDRTRFELGEDYETGGWLYGTTWSWRPTIRLATELGLNGKQARDAVTFDPALKEAYSRELVEVFDNRDDRLIGSWHVHPRDHLGRPDPGLPSETDMDGWLAGHDLRHDGGPFLGLIVTSDREHGWYRPQFHLWSTARRTTGTPVCERVALVESKSR